MKHDTQLTQEQRYPMDAYRKAGLNQTETAEKVRVDKSTISREIRRSRGPRGYFVSHAARSRWTSPRSRRSYSQGSSWRPSSSALRGRSSSALRRKWT